ncbi:MAG: exo-alpha-sialidase [Armatimonadetes bacterium]|nr:exo-alpha-sialidase [Armatimonadota bacterium]
MAKLTLKSSTALPVTSPLMYAAYLKPTGLEMVKLNAYSADNGATWTSWLNQPDFDRDLPHGYRREGFPIFVDWSNGRIVRLVPSMDTEGLDPTLEEPPIALQTYYLRYRVSLDGGRAYLFDDVVVQQGKTPLNPVEGVTRGRNGIFMGDVGSQMIRTRAGKVLIPAQACLLGEGGKLANPGGGWTYTDVVILIGTWTTDGHLTWEVGQRIEGDPGRSTRGMIEPALAELSDGRLLCVMRGSNGGAKDPEWKLPSYRWQSVSTDGGYHWSKPEPMTYDDGQPFHSPSSMSQLLMHSSGRLLWIGNLSDANCRGNDPRHPLVIGRVDTLSLRLVRGSVLVVDDKRPDEPGVNLSHFWTFEDRATHDIVIAGARYSEGYKAAHPHLWRVGVE